MKSRADAWIYADMSWDELQQRRDALQSLVNGTTGRKQRRYLAELHYVDALIACHSHEYAVQLHIDSIFDIMS